MHRNIEIKARVDALDRARAAAAQVATEHVGALHQIDTYFHCQHGRLKLREIADHGAELIWYQRGDHAAARQSLYRRVPVPDPVGMKIALSGALGVRVVVDKRRDVYLVRNVRIHVDEVRELGSFVELEAVLGEVEPDAADADARESRAHADLRALREALGVTDDALVAGSYSDLLADRR